MVRRVEARVSSIECDCFCRRCCSNGSPRIVGQSYIQALPVSKRSLVFRVLSLAKGTKGLFSGGTLSHFQPFEQHDQVGLLRWR